MAAATESAAPTARACRSTAHARRRCRRARAQEPWPPRSSQRRSGYGMGWGWRPIACAGDARVEVDTSAKMVKGRASSYWDPPDDEQVRPAHADSADVRQARQAHGPTL